MVIHSLSSLALYPLCGAAAGLLAGLLGIGGGLVVVPALSRLLLPGAQEETIMHLALGTSLASMIFTAGVSARAHARRGALVRSAVWGMGPAVALGTLLGSHFAAFISTAGLKLFFAGFLALVAIQMLGDFYPPARREAPGRPLLAGAGFLIGGFSSLAGLGGGALFVPFLRWLGCDLRQAVGTSSALGLAIAAAGTAGFMASGWGLPGLPPGSLGYVNLPAALGVAAGSVLFAPLGVRLSHALPRAALRRIFAVFLLLMAGRFLWELQGWG